MMHDIQIQHYARVSRTVALQVLQKANLEPLKLTAHRDGTFTARYRRKSILSPESYEHRIEFASEHPVAIFKRPNKLVDRGPYATLQFAFGKAAFAITARKLPAQIAHSNGTVDAPAASVTVLPPQTMALLTGEAHSIQQLSAEAERMFRTEELDHLPVVLEELTRHAAQLTALIDSLGKPAGD